MAYNSPKLTEEQLQEAYERHQNGETVRALAEEYGQHSSSLFRRFKTLERRQNIDIKDPFFNGATILQRIKDKDDTSAGVVMQWVRENVSLKKQYEKATQLLDSLAKQVKPLPPIPYTLQPSSDMLTVIPIGDPHIGLQCWSKECGVDWDLKIAERVNRKVFARLLSQLPDTEECILINTGDLFHADNIQGESSRSGHKFDLDGRHGKWIDTAGIILQMWVDACLRKYKKVHFVNVPGNHDDILGRFVGTYIDGVYRNNSRLTIQKGDNPFQYVHRNKVLLGFAHGHTCKLSSLPGKMADDMAVLWGQTTFREWITGHVHHNSWQQFKEHPGASVRTVGIIPPKDVWAHGSGYGAGRGIQAFLYDTEVGYNPIRVSDIVRATD